MYDVLEDAGETKNLADVYPDVVARLTKSLVAWHRSMPPDKGDEFRVNNDDNNTFSQEKHGK